MSSKELKNISLDSEFKHELEIAQNSTDSSDEGKNASNSNLDGDNKNVSDSSSQKNPLEISNISNLFDFFEYLHSIFAPDELKNISLENKFEHELEIAQNFTENSIEGKNAANSSLGNFNGSSKEIMNTLDPSIYPNIYRNFNNSYALAIYKYLTSMFVKSSNFSFTNKFKNISFDIDEEHEVLGVTGNFTAKLEAADSSARGDLGVVLHLIYCNCTQLSCLFAFTLYLFFTGGFFFAVL